MTEADWLTCPDPEPMLRFLMWNEASERKLRLFAVACARRASDLFAMDRLVNLVDLARLLADGRAPMQDVELARTQCYSDVMVVLLGPAAQAADEVSLAIAQKRGGRLSPRFAAERAAQADLLREVFGNPIRPIKIDPTWLAWDRDFIPALAQGIYADRTFHRVPYLADALEEAGATGLLLEHLRIPGCHFRGCWAIDACMNHSD